jgi:hypothetical protein
MAEPDLKKSGSVFFIFIRLYRTCLVRTAGHFCFLHGIRSLPFLMLVKIVSAYSWQKESMAVSESLIIPKCFQSL